MYLCAGTSWTVFLPFCFDFLKNILNKHSRWIFISSEIKIKTYVRKWGESTVTFIYFHVNIFFQWVEFYLAFAGIFINDAIQENWPKASKMVFNEILVTLSLSFFVSCKKKYFCVHKRNFNSYFCFPILKLS